MYTFFAARSHLTFIFFSKMAPFGLLSHSQNLVDGYHTQRMVEEYLANRGSSTTASPIIDMEDELGLVCLCTSYMRTQDTLSCLE